MARPKIFISGSSIDSPTRRDLAAALDRAGVDVFTDVKGVASIRDAIDLAIQGSDGILLLFEVDRAPSTAITWEWETALESSWSEGKPLIPVVEDGAETPPFLGSYFWIRYPSRRIPGVWDVVADGVAKILQHGTDAEKERPYREKAQAQWRERLNELRATVAPLAAAERSGTK